MKHMEIHNTQSEEEVRIEYIEECKEAIENFPNTYEILKKSFGTLKTNKIHKRNSAYFHIKYKFYWKIFNKFLTYKFIS